jgi:DNA transposition AAA+ family ATPase
MEGRMGATAAAAVEPEDKDDVVWDPKAATARIMSGLQRDPATLKAAAKADRLEGFIDLVREDLQAYLVNSGQSQAAVAKALGENAAYVNQFLKGRFPVPAQEARFARAVSRYLERAGRRAERILEAEFVDTEPARQILKILENADDNREMVLIVGRSGIGKSQAALRFAALNQKQAIYILAGEHIRAPRAFLSHLASKIGLAGHLRFADLFERVIDKLRDSGRFLIVDEAEFLAGDFGDRTVEMLRQLRERTAIGLAFISNEVFWKRINGDRTKEQLEKFTTRLAVRKFLKKRCLKSDVEAIVHRHLNGAADEILARIFDRAQKAGAFRAVAVYCRRAADFAARDGGDVTPEMLDKVEALVEGELEDAQ